MSKLIDITNKNIDSLNNHYPIISDEIITLYCEYYNKKQLYENDYIHFTIILNETKDKIGFITLDCKRKNFSFVGNVGYSIKESFQGNNYGTQALRLLKKFIIENNFNNKNLYITVSSENIASQKIAENNNGKLIYDGDIPKNYHN